MHSPERPSHRPAPAAPPPTTTTAQCLEQMGVLAAACAELRDCPPFMKLLQAVLELGNHLNQGTQRGAAAGFRLDTLLKLADVKGVDRKTSLLHFVVKQVRGGGGGGGEEGGGGFRMAGMVLGGARVLQLPRRFMAMSGCWLVHRMQGSG